MVLIYNRQPPVPIFFRPWDESIPWYLAYSLLSTNTTEPEDRPSKEFDKVNSELRSAGNDVQSSPHHSVLTSSPATLEPLSQGATVATDTIHPSTPPREIPFSPPATPEVARLNGAGSLVVPKNSPTKLGATLLTGGYRFKARYPPPLTLKQLWTDDKKDEVKSWHVQTCAMKGVKVSDKKPGQYLKKCLKVAEAFVIGPPTDPDWAEQQEYALRLVFAKNIRLQTRYLSYLTIGTSTPTHWIKPLLRLGNTFRSRPLRRNPKTVSLSISLLVSPPSPRTMRTGSNLQRKSHGIFSPYIKFFSKTLPLPILNFAALPVWRHTTSEWQ